MVDFVVAIFFWCCARFFVTYLWPIVAAVIAAVIGGIILYYLTGKQKKVWEKKLADLPNLENILISIDSGRFVATLFDRGSFNLAVLWSCNLMEQIVDAVVAEIISRNPQRMEFFKKEDSGPVGYPKQLRNLGFKPSIEKNRKDEQITTEALWHKIRNDIAHRNYKPTFQQTSGTICILVSFMEEMPEILEAWK
jgi:hypothetical protein